jgi:hypothetical protein
MGPSPIFRTRFMKDIIKKFKLDSSTVTVQINVPYVQTSHNGETSIEHMGEVILTIRGHQTPPKRKNKV